MALSGERRLTLTLGITVLIFLLEVVGGMLSNSLALLSDAGHVLTDIFTLSLSIIAMRISRRPSDHRATYGYQRVGLLAAVINGVSLAAISAFIFFESYKRFASPHQIDISLMLSIAMLGLAGNVIMAFIIGSKHEDLNIKSAWLHVLGDALCSFGVVVSGVAIFFTHWVYADPLASVIIGIVILSGGVRVVREATVIFLEMSPPTFHAEEIAKRLCAMPEVMGVHDVHIWSVAHKKIAFTAHIWIQDQRLSESEAIRQKIENLLKEMGINHIILQFECAECLSTGLYCQIHNQE
jgi:cobalt-zinc-cadmium efflux system protein